MSAVNHQFRLAARPVGLPKRSDWSLTEEPVPEPSDGEFLVKILYISLDPAMRGWMNEGRSYIAPVGIGEVMRAGAVGRVILEAHRLRRRRPRVWPLRGSGICSLERRRRHQG
jgi:NADPH-dependent curcumin reductase